MMTEKKLYKRLMAYKKKHGVTQEIYQHYLWAVKVIRQQLDAKAKNQ
ncbi:hypothetical protein GCM10007384_33770 [Aquimarina muelleri]|uniref:Uncharacterized protein n=1 Tax=Aquimarina muelleri TaxID=279356 RepID=A0A918JXR4_9FLAO|nr:hypothetical protein GCM10007384_33770 [Aquimarina muelleri]